MTNAEPIEVGRRDHGIRVLVLTNMYPTKTEPHFGCFVKDQGDDLRRLGVDLSVLAFDGRAHKNRYSFPGFDIHLRTNISHARDEFDNGLHL